MFSVNIQEVIKIIIEIFILGSFILFFYLMIIHAAVTMMNIIMVENIGIKIVKTFFAMIETII